MKLVTKEIEGKLRKNHRLETEAERADKHFDSHPVVKFFTPDAQATWLITSMDQNGIMFGLCDLGMGFPELGYVSLRELAGIRGPMGLAVERDKFFTAKKSIMDYAGDASSAGRIES